MLIETERLSLRPLCRSDVEDFLALHDDEENKRYFGRYDRERALQRLERSKSEWSLRGYGTFHVVARETGRFLGRVGLKDRTELQETEIGWALVGDARGKGYAGEAAVACLDWAFRTLSVPYLTAMIHPVNAPSRALAERLGMTVLREDVLEGEEVIVYALWPPGGDRSVYSGHAR